MFGFLYETVVRKFHYLHKYVLMDGKGNQQVGKIHSKWNIEYFIIIFSSGLMFGEISMLLASAAGTVSLSLCPRLPFTRHPSLSHRCGPWLTLCLHF